MSVFSEGKKIIKGIIDPPTPSIDSDGTNVVSNSVKFKITDVKQGQGSQGSATFLGAIGKLSNIQALGKATKGLTAIHQTAIAGGPGLTNLINSGGKGVVDFVARVGGSDEQGNPTLTGNDVFGAINKINPSTVNSAVAAGDDIVDKLKNGEFNLETIPQYTRDFANLFKLGARLLDPFFKKKPETVIEVQSHPNYAQDYVDIFGGPKFPWKYAVKFDYNPTYQQIGDLPAAFMVKSCDRPQVEYDTEDVNYYNYRSKLIKKTSFKPISMSFYDDQLSSVLAFINTYMQIMIPITNISKDTTSQGIYDGKDINGLINSFDRSNQHNGKKTAPELPVHNNAASLSIMDDSTVTQSILSQITIYHFTHGGAFCDVYRLINPKIIDMQLDQLNNATNDASAITVTWAYDNINIIPLISTKHEDIAKEVNYVLTQAGDKTNLKRVPASPALMSTPTNSTLNRE